MYGWRARLGILIPSANAVAEPEFNRLVPPGVCTLATRMWLTKDSEEEVNALIDYAANGARLLSHAGVDVIGFTCTAGSFVQGKGYDGKVMDIISEAVKNVKVTTTSTAVLEALKAVGARKLAVATPYPNWVNPKLQKYLEDNGFSVVAIDGLGFEGPEISEYPPEQTRRLVASTFTADADAVFISCTGFRTIDIIEGLEQDLGVPVISSNLATFWKMLRLSGVKDKIHGYGQLLSEF